MRIDLSVMLRAAYNAVIGLLAALALALPSAAGSQPIELKLAVFTSEASEMYRFGIKPFVDAVNAEAQGLVSIKVYANGKLGKNLAEHPQMLLNGTADIAWVVPGQTPYRFPDNEVLEMPGLFRDLRESTLVYTRLATTGALRGYGDFFVVAAYGTAPGVVHSRNPVESLADLRGLKIRSNNAVEAEALAKLGAIPTVMPVSMLADAVNKGSIDAVVLSPAGLYQFGAPIVAKNHYLLSTGTAPLAILMNRQRFESLPEAAKAVIRRYSGENAAAPWIEFYGGTERRSLDRIKSDPAGKAVEPSPADIEATHRVYQALLQNYAAKSAQNRRLVDLIEAELSIIRSDNR